MYRTRPVSAVRARTDSASIPRRFRPNSAASQTAAARAVDKSVDDLLVRCGRAVEYAARRREKPHAPVDESVDKLLAACGPPVNLPKKQANRR
ncbi:hypothetical protein PT2222_10344 [Paraburkholderia tropica]